MLRYSGMEIKKLINKNWWAFFYLQMLIILLSYIHGGINFAKNPKKGFGAVRGFYQVIPIRYPFTDAFLVFKYPRFGWGACDVCSGNLLLKVIRIITPDMISELSDRPLRRIFYF